MMIGREVPGKVVALIMVGGEVAEIMVGRHFRGLLWDIRPVLGTEIVLDQGEAKMIEGLEAVGMIPTGAAGEVVNPRVIAVEGEDIGGMETVGVVAGKEGIRGQGTTHLTVPALGLVASQVLAMGEGATTSTIQGRAWEELTGLEEEEVGEVDLQVDFQHRPDLSAHGWRAPHEWWCPAFWGPYAAATFWRFRGVRGWRVRQIRCI